MADTRYFVYATEPLDHYTSQLAAEAAAVALSSADQDNTYYVVGAVIETIAEVSAAGVVTITPTPDERWDNHFVGWHFDEASGTRMAVGTGGGCTDDLSDVNSNIGIASGKFSSAADLNDAGTDEILRANGLDFRMSGDWTWIGWVYKAAAWPAGTDVPVVAALDDSDSPDWGLFSTSSSTFFEFFDSSSGSVTVTKDMTSASTWYFVSVVYDSATRIARCALNAESFTDSSALGTGLRQLSTRLDINATTGAHFYVDEHHFFTEAKGDDWVVEMYNGGSGRLYPYG